MGRPTEVGVTDPMFAVDKPEGRIHDPLFLITRIQPI